MRNPTLAGETARLQEGQLLRRRRPPQNLVPVRKAAKAGDDVEVAVRDRVEAAGVDGEPLAERRVLGGDDGGIERHADAARADALMARILGTVDKDGAVTFDRAAATVITTEIVIDLDTLNGLADRVALINGQPAPAGRRSWRRPSSGRLAATTAPSSTISQATYTHTSKIGTAAKAP